ncbi:MAG: hypothetical protein KKI08_24895, partial [Armatimonadetes bacterium]|nr:hypothetical protein [Armatimonadota bacterium]
MDIPSVTVGTKRIDLAGGIHHDPWSARDTLAAALQRRPEAVCVELPETFAHNLPRVFDELYPVPAVLTAKPTGAPNGTLSRAVVVTPADHISQAARWALANGVPLFGVDLLIDRPQEGTTLGHFDPYIMHAAGMVGWGRLAPMMEQGRVAEDALRERHMASRLRSLCAQFGSILWVGGAAHLLPLRRLLAADADSQPPDAPEPELRFSVALLDPHVALRRYLGEIPAMTWAFHLWTETSPETIHEFDLWDQHTAMVREAAEHYRAAYSGPSPRALAQFELFLRKLLKVRGRVSPTLQVLYEAACAAMDPSFASLLLDKALAYPFPNLRRAGPGENGYPVLSEVSSDAPDLLRSSDGTSGEARLINASRSAQDANGGSSAATAVAKRIRARTEQDRTTARLS